MTTPPFWSAIVLAAGQSNRFGGGKLRAVYRQRPVLDWVLEGALSCPVAEVLVVWGGDERILSHLPKDDRVRAVSSEAYIEGMGASLVQGIQALNAQCTGAFVFLGDMPRVPFGLAGSLIAAIGQGGLAAAPVHLGRRGHPVLISSPLFEQLSKLTGDRGASAILDQLGSKLVLIDAPDDGCLFDIDRPEDLLV